MADIHSSFELRKLQWKFSRAPAGGTTEDVAVMTFHFIKTPTPQGPWDDVADLGGIETLVRPYWGGLAPYYPPWIISDQFRWYKDGPAYYKLNGDGTGYIPVGGNEAVRVTEENVPGTLSVTSMLPPQVAISVTELTSDRRHWGRWYLPAPSSILAEENGRVHTAELANMLSLAGAFYGQCIASGFQPVVFSIQKPARPKRPSGTLPEQEAIAFAVTELQMDNLFDVIRRRRYDHATQKLKTGPL